MPVPSRRIGGLIDDCWRRAREVAARVLANDMVQRIMRDGSDGGEEGGESESEMEMDAVATGNIHNFWSRASRTI